ncbi:MAG: cysteine hydrolase, partial [Elusimicrobia bacterium]|nr:cysteine hydrolase [Elusimicrobiota bacterium]
GDRKIILSFAPAPEERLDAAVLCRVFPPDKFAVKITPVYRTGAADRSGATHPWRQAPASLRDLAHELNSRGLEAFLNPLPLQVDLQAVFCGQLWSAKLKAKAAVIAANRAREAQSYVSSGTLAAKALSWQRETAGLRRREFPLRWERAGLMVMDMQRIFMDPRSRAYLPAARAIAANVRRLAEAFKRAGRPAYFVFHPHENPSRAEIAAILSPFAEKTFLKRRYNAFSNAALEKALRRDKIEELVFAGVTTNLCVESTLRDAFDKGFLCFLALDASAARTEDLHLASLKNLSYGFSTLRTTDEILSFLPAD